jgi:hypothetical protein
MGCGRMRGAATGGSVIVRTIITWLALVVLAILNGGVREAVLVPPLGLATAHFVSTILLCGLILAVSWFATPWIGPSTARAALVVGSIWLLMTLGFEFLAGHFLFRKAWPVLLADYNLLAGRVWVFVPVVTLLAPLLAWKGRGR